MTSCLFDAIESRKVVTCDIPAAYLSAKWPDDVECTLEFEGAMVKLITEIEPRYEPYVITYNEGTDWEQKVLYAKLRRAVYGTLLGGVLFYKKLKKQLEDWDFEMNPYDNCVFNKVVDGNQVTFCFFFDDCKISHVEQEVIDDILTDLNNVFATKKKRVSVTKGSVHDYLGITIDYREEGKVKFTMYNFLEDIIAEAPAGMNGTAVNPARDNLFETQEDTSPPLDMKIVDLFHRTTSLTIVCCKMSKTQYTGCHSLLVYEGQRP